jgi:hypothetical protein
MGLRFFRRIRIVPGVTLNRTVIGFTLFILSSLVGMLVIWLTNESPLYVGLMIACGWSIIADWIAGRSSMVHNTLGEIYQKFRRGDVPPLPPLPWLMQMASRLLLAALVIYWLVR